MALPSLVTRSLLQTDFLDLEMDYARRIAVLRRSAAPFRQPQDADRTIAALAQALPDHLRQRSRILIDMRAAPMRASPELENSFQRYRDETERGFERVAVLVQTALGKVRSDRLMASCKTQLAVFLSWDEALDWLMGA